MSAPSLHALLGEAHELHELEHTGVSGWTPFVAILGLVLFFGGVFLLMSILAEAAYYGIA